MTRLRFLALMLMGTLVLSSCSIRESGSLRLTSSLPKGIVPNNAVFEFGFSQAVVKPDSVNMWTTTPYVEFTPRIEGKFVWQDSLRLVFSPDAALPGDTKFKGRLNTELLIRTAGVKTFKGDEEFSFSTEPFYLKSAEFFYDRIDNKRTVGVRANLEFTYTVNPDELAKHIKIAIDGQPHLQFKAVTAAISRVTPVEIGSLTQLEKDREIRIEFDNDFVSPESQTRLTMQKPFVYRLPGLEELKIYGHAFGYDGTDSWIRIKTSQEVDLKTAQSFIELSPVRGYKLVGDDRLSFTLRGKFEPGTAFRLVIKQGLESVLGAKTKNPYDADIIIGNVKPSFGFTSPSGVYMLLAGARTIDFKTINLSKLQVRVSQIFQNNLVHFLSGGRQYDYDYSYDEEEGREYYRRKYRYAVGNYGRLLDQKTITINGSPNQEVTTAFELTPYLRTDYKGFYLVEIADPDESWRSTSKLISISDIGLIIKQAARTLHVFAVSLETNSPIAGALINLISTNNQTIASLRTDGDGVARFDNSRELAKGFEIKLVTAEKGDDFNFLNLSDYRVETSRFDVEGKYDARGLYDAFLYGDRNLYRPGEKIYVSGIVRSLNEKLPEGMPVRIKINNPKGTMISEIQHTLNEESSFEASYQTSTAALTGEYEFALYTGNGIFLTSYKVSVEDFVPDRIRISLDASSQIAKPGEKVVYSFEALNFFGPPAAGRNWEFEASFEAIPYRSKQFPEFRFNDDAAKAHPTDVFGDKGTTDDQGKGETDFAIPKEASSPGLLRLRGRVGVFDESGRPVYQMASTTVYPKDYYIGIQGSGDYYISPNTPQKIRMIAVDMNDKPMSGFKARVDLIRREWHSVLRMHPESKALRYVSEQQEALVQSQEVLLKDSPTEYTYSVPRSGDYVVRVSKVGDTGYNQLSFYSYSWETADITSFEVNPEARVEMVFDKVVYAPGDKARILFQTPFSGRMLVTVERSKMFSYRYLDVEKNSASMELDVDESFLPNVYVTAVLFRKIRNFNIPLMVGHGFSPLTVEKNSNRLNITISAPEKIRPKSKQKLTLTIPDEKNVFVTLAAVDEGICQIKNYKTPDPYGYFYAKKALQMETFDFFRDLIPEPDKQRKAASSTGGGDGEEMAKRVNPLGVQRFKPVALWSGILKTNSSGEAEMTFDVPEFSGELRLMALAYKGNRFGSVQKAMKVSDPVVVTPALPRFLSPNDVITMPITAFNTTDKPVSLNFEIQTEGGITAVQKSASLNVGANRERFVPITLKSSDQIGKAVIRVKTQALGEKLESVTELPIRPISAYVTESIAGVVEAGKTVTHTLEDLFLPYGRRSFVTVSPFPVANFSKQLKFLVGYPHGCLEQTTSKAFPQIYLRDIAVILDPSILDKGSPTYFVNEAISKITLMQTNDGAFEYWPGGGYSNPWTTVYVTHFLIEAKKAGYVVPEATLKAALNAVSSIARSNQTTNYYFVENNRTLIRRIADKSAVYALYVLASATQTDLSVMNFYRTAKALLTMDTQYLLAGAFALSGDRKTYVELLPPQFAAEEAQRTSGGCYDSPIRANAIILNVLLETDPNNPNIPRYMDYLSREYKKDYWYSTQDDAFTLLAFGKAARMAGGAKIKGTVAIEGKQFSYGGGNKRFDLDGVAKTVSISLSGEGRAYYSIVTEGIRRDGKVRIEDKNLRVRREFFDRNGSPVDLEDVKQNSLIIVKLTLACDIGHLENVAVTDLLPGGFEIENPRLTETTQYSFIKGATTPQYVDLRDDRINYYTSFAGQRQQVFFYMVRAVTRGEFQYPPVVAEAMYDANYYSASGQAKLRVVE